MRRLIVVLSLVAASALSGQQPCSAAKPGWEKTGIPALNFNSDEGVGYGVVGELTNYAAGLLPYRVSIQPTVLLTTKGRRDASVFIDAPHLLSHAWRLDAYLAREQQFATPYYGIGNATPHDEMAEEPPNPYYYRYGRQGYRVTMDVQRPLRSFANSGCGQRELRLLAGAGIRTSTIDKMPYDSGSTLLVRESGAAPMPHGRAVHVRLGLVLDTRDQEVGPNHGIWAEALAQHAGRLTEGSTEFTRLTLTARGYASPFSRVTFAERVILQDLQGDVPFYELFTVQSSYKDDEGLGGSGTLRGWPKDRFAGKGMALVNNEVRWRALTFSSLLGRPSAVVLSGFVDAGRVWADHLDLSQIGSGLHVGEGGGVRFQYGPSFIVGVDAARSRETGLAIYIGLGYPY